MSKEFGYDKILLWKGVYMRVSAISEGSNKTFFNNVNARLGENCLEFSSKKSETKLINPLTENKVKIFELINEWKDFCHHQIECGKFDIIA